jgi:hypothetical protein
MVIGDLVTETPTDDDIRHAVTRLPAGSTLVVEHGRDRALVQPLAPDEYAVVTHRTIRRQRESWPHTTVTARRRLGGIPCVSTASLTSGTPGGSSLRLPPRTSQPTSHEMDGQVASDGWQSRTAKTAHSAHV